VLLEETKTIHQEGFSEKKGGSGWKPEPQEASNFEHTQYNQAVATSLAATKFINERIILRGTSVALRSCAVAVSSLVIGAPGEESSGEEMRHRGWAGVIVCASCRHLRPACLSYKKGALIVACRVYWRQLRRIYRED
jgi:hypothetical protein